jgi:hypothetical protein
MIHSQVEKLAMNWRGLITAPGDAAQIESLLFILSITSKIEMCYSS